jgi:hypothetical protein
MRLLTVALALTTSAPTKQPPLPARLHCEVRGEAGCGNHICTGHGTHDAAIRMDIDTVGQKIVLNGLRGRIEGAAALDYGQTRSVIWTHKIIGLREVAVSRSRDYRDRSGKPFAVVNLQNDTWQLEFMCRPR